jgi:BirA family biotin operon repressor/biotin-[acetyl-CoA-carboxylase] ligase
MSINQLTRDWAQQQNLPVFFTEETPSTNDWAKKHFVTTSEKFALYLADHQSAGRGRGSNSWQNQAHGHTLLSTWCFKRQKSPQPILTPLLGLALCQALDLFALREEPRLKPPNDIHLGPGKLSGLLVEVAQQGADHSVFIGLGLNVLSHPKVDVPTTHLKSHCPEATTLWSEFCSALYHQFDQAISSGQERQLTERHRQDLLRRLNVGLSSEKQYRAVTSHCDLITPSGQISWMDL